MKDNQGFFVEKVQKGYYYAISNDMAEACDTWLGAWDDFVEIVDEKGIKIQGEVDCVFSWSPGYFLNWLTDFQMELKKRAEKKPELHRSIIKICSYYLKRFDNNSNDIFLMLTRRTLAESAFAEGKEEKADAYFKRCLERNPTWTEGWINWAHCWVKYGGGTKSNYKKATKILKKALEQKLEGGKLPVYEKLKSIYIITGEEEQVEKVSVLMKECWGQDS